MAKVEIFTLDAKPTASLDWKDFHPKAMQAIASGKTILWHLDLGLFQNLSKPLENSSQFLNLGLALDHFKDTLWKEFHRFTKGLALYRGPSTFSKVFPWSLDQQNNFQLWLKDRQIDAFESISSPRGQFLIELYTRDVCAEYLEQLIERLPDEIPAYILFDSLTEDTLLRPLLTHPERYGRMSIYSPENYTWRTQEELPVGICFPPLDEVRPERLEKWIPLLEKVKTLPIKLIPEEKLTSSWDRLNDLIYSSQSISSQGLRKLRGFEAAGGNLIELELLDKGSIESLCRV